ncbi:hypothetical protein NQ318_022083 [Aromia moschata]|uniref:Uncharacterized protein n=1 Tax=Aromia moschata TaxID=1265417 RepID=A0AAV8Z894_9CUCU|nr:hypothetical protein NQ318_022083 [Aromia moschata]
MAWLNLNNSINTLKGQITNFASNVLADEGPDITNKDVEELRNICIQQEIEINNLKRINQELSDQQIRVNLNAALQYL